MKCVLYQYMAASLVSMKFIKCHEFLGRRDHCGLSRIKSLIYVQNLNFCLNFSHYVEKYSDFSVLNKLYNRGIKKVVDLWGDEILDNKIFILVLTS